MKRCVENIYVENIKCFSVVEKSDRCFELYIFNNYSKEGHLIGSYNSYKVAEETVNIRLGRVKRKYKF